VVVGAELVVAAIDVVLASVSPPPHAPRMTAIDSASVVRLSVVLD